MTINYGWRLPAAIIKQVFTTRFLRVSESFAESTQLAKSLRSSDVSLLH